MKQTKSFAQVVQRMSLMAVFLLLTLICYAQSIIVKGSIKDQAGDPIAGTTVKILGTTTGGVSDADGHYSISCSAQSTLEFSYIGFSTRAIDVKGRKNIDVTLDEGSQNIDEVVVTALGIKKDAKKLGYAVSSIGSADLSRTGSPSIASGLYGKATGYAFNQHLVETLLSRYRCAVCRPSRETRNHFWCLMVYPFTTATPTTMTIGRINALQPMAW